MEIKTKHLYGVLLALSPFVPMIGSITGLPTQMSLLWYAAQPLLALTLLQFTRPILHGLIRRAALPALYVMTFIGISLFGVSPHESIQYRVLWLPLLLIDFAAWYCAGYFIEEKVFLRLFTVCIAIFGVASLVLFALRTEERAISGPDVPFAIGPAVMLSESALAVALLIMALASLKKTVAACAFAVFLYARLVRGRFPKRPLKVIGIPRAVTWAIGGFATLGALGFMLVAVLPYLSATASRITEEGSEDTLRLAMIAEYLRLLPEYFPWGTGYYTFGYLTADTIDFTTVLPNGEILYGMSLHNSYMHWSLEGGLAILILVALMYLSYWRTVRLIRPLSKPLANVLISWLIAAGIFGMFNQFHGTPYFFGMLGYAAGCWDRYKYATHWSP